MTVAAVDTDLLKVRKISPQGVEVTHRERVEFVVMALRAGEGRGQPGGAGGAHAVGHVFDKILLRLRPAFFGRAVEAVIAAGDKQFGAPRSFRQPGRHQVAGQLLAGEGVKALVGIERRDDVIAVGGDRHVLVAVVADGVRIPHKVEPLNGQPFAKMG